MILGRPTNLWLGLITAGVALVQGLAVTVFNMDAQQVATVGALVIAFLGAGVALVAHQPPTLNPGDTFKVSTPEGAPSETRTA